MAILRFPTLLHFPYTFWASRKESVDEETPLLEEIMTKHSIAVDIFDKPSPLPPQRELRDELVAIIKYCIPLMITFLLSAGNRLVDVWFLGKVGPEAMAVASLGGLFITITGTSMGVGILTAIDTLVAQAFTGAKNAYTIGVILQRGLIIIYIFGAAIALLWTWAEDILLYMGQQPELARKAQEYITVFTPNLFIIFTTTALRKFLQGLGEMKVTMYLVFVVFPINAALDYFFIMYLGLGYVGAAYQSIVYFIITLTFYVLFTIYCTDAKKYWPGLTTQAFSRWGEFLKLGIPGMLSVSTDWAFEVCAIFAGVLGQTSLAAQSVVLTVNMLLLMVPSSISTALIVRLGHHLGSNQPRKTILCVTISTLLGLTSVIFNAGLMYVYRDRIAHAFSTDEEVILAIDELMCVGSLSHFALGFGIVLSATLNALGKQHMVATFNIISYYGIGLPAGLYLTKEYNWGLVGIWSGVVISGIVKSMAEAILILFFIDWKQECLVAAKRINKQEI